MESQTASEEERVELFYDKLDGHHEPDQSHDARKHAFP